MEQLKGLIYNIQSFSLHDGPGCRTTCFMSGCPLRCDWCANPESFRLSFQLMFASVKCKHKSGCEMCLEACEEGISVRDGAININHSVCSQCNHFKCTQKCYHDALKKVGKYYTIEDIINILSRDRQYWDSKGGVTFSGGEPFFQKIFLYNILKSCKESYIHTAIETTAFVDKDTFIETFKYVDFAFVDIKNMDREKHKQKTGVYNDIILENISALANSKHKGRLVLRMPVIRDFNDNEENIIKTADFMNSLGLYEINILPFHRLGASKWEQLGLDYNYKDEEAYDEKLLEKIQDIFLDRRIACYIGSDTNF